MSNNVQLQTRIRLIAEQLEKGVSNSEIIKEYSPQWSVTERTVERYIAIAKDVVLERMQSIDALIEAVRGAVVAEEAEKQLRSNIELEAKLVAIIEGELETEKLISRSEGVIEVKSRPSRKEIMRAIELLWKKRGLFEHREKNDRQNTPGMPEIKVSNEEERKLIEQTFKLP